MALNLPDIVKHSNSNYAIVDSDSLRGGTKTAVANLTSLYQLSASYAQAGILSTLKSYSTKVWVISENQYYTLVDETSAGKAVGWVPDNQYVNTTFFRLSGGTISGDTLFTTNATISGSLSAKGITYLNNAFFQSATAVSLSGVFYGSGWNLDGVDRSQPTINTWVRANTSVAVSYNTLSATNVYGGNIGTPLFTTQGASTIATNTALGSATIHGVFYGDGRNLIGSAFDQDSINAFVRSNSSTAVFNTVSANLINGNFIGTTLFNIQSANAISTNTALGSSTFHGVYYGDGWNLDGVDRSQPTINSWVRANTSIAVNYNTLSSNFIYGNFLGSQTFKTNNAAEITTNTLQGSATMHGVFYGDGRRLLGSAFDQDVVNAWVRSNSSVATDFSRLSSNNINANFIGTTLFSTQSANLVTTNTNAGSSTFHGVYYGDGQWIDNITVGNRRFEYFPATGGVLAYSYSGVTRSVYSTTSDFVWKITKVQYDYDGTVIGGLSAVTNAQWVARASYTYNLI